MNGNDWNNTAENNIEHKPLRVEYNNKRVKLRAGDGGDARRYLDELYDIEECLIERG